MSNKNITQITKAKKDIPGGVTFNVTLPANGYFCILTTYPYKSHTLNCRLKKKKRDIRETCNSK